MKQKKKETNNNKTYKRKEKEDFKKTKLAPCIHSSHNDLFLFWNQFFRICQECISTDSIYEQKKKDENIYRKTNYEI